MLFQFTNNCLYDNDIDGGVDSRDGCPARRMTAVATRERTVARELTLRIPRIRHISAFTNSF